jgi:hypothetical protein
MRCPYCGSQNDEAAERCSHCGQDLPLDRAPWKGPDGPGPSAGERRPLSSNEEWDPAYRYAEPRPISVFVPPAAYPNYRVWAVTVTILCFPPTGIVALLCGWLVDLKQARGDDDRAYRYSQLAKLWCQISVVMGIVIYVCLFLWLISYAGHFWPY